MIDGFAKSKGFTPDLLRSYGVRDGFDGIEVPYYNADGSAYVRYRIRSGDRGFAWSPGDAPVIPYGLNRPVPYTKGTVVIVEGESDCWALWSQKVAALGVPGATSTGCLHADQLDGATEVAIVREPDEAGMRFPQRVARRLRETGFAGRLSALSFAPHKDPRAAFAAQPERFRDVLRAVWKARVPIVDAPATKPQPKPRLVSDMLAEPEQPLTWLVEGLLPTRAVLLLAGEYGTGKSVLGRNLLRGVSDGATFLGLSCAQGPALWISAGGEESEATFKRHMRKLGVGTAPIYYTDAVPNAARDRAAWYAEMVAEFKPSVVVVDTIIGLLELTKSTDRDEVALAIEPYLALRDRFETAHVWLHHTNNGGGVYGAGSWGRVPDVVALYSKGEDGSRYLRTTKGRDDIMLPSTLIDYDSESGLVGNAGARLAMDVARAEQKILDSGRYGSRRDLEKCGVEKNAARIAFDNLLARGLYVTRRNGRGAIYYPADAAPPVNGELGAVIDLVEYAREKGLVDEP